MIIYDNLSCFTALLSVKLVILSQDDVHCFCKASLLLVLGGCGKVLEGVKFEGAIAPNGNRPKVGSAGACGALCDGEKCRYWTWFSKGQLCRLFTKRTAEKPENDAISGECTGRFPWSELLLFFKYNVFLVCTFCVDADLCKKGWLGRVT